MKNSEVADLLKQVLAEMVRLSERLEALERQVAMKYVAACYPLPAAPMNPTPIFPYQPNWNPSPFTVMTGPHSGA